MPTVQLPNGTELEFPDGMSQDAMRDAIYKNFPEFAPKSAGTSLIDKVGSAASGMWDAVKSDVSQAFNGQQSVMDNLPAQDAATTGTDDPSIGPLRKDYVTRTKQELQAQPLADQVSAAKAGGQQGKIAQQVAASTVRRATNPVPLTQDDVSQDAGAFLSRAPISQPDINDGDVTNPMGDVSGSLSRAAQDSDPNDVGMGESLLRANIQGTSLMGKTAGLAVSAPAVVYDAIKNSITGGNDTSASDWMFKTFVDPHQQRIEWATIKPEEKQNFLGKVSAGIGGLLADLPYMIISGGTSAEAQATQKVAEAAPSTAQYLAKTLEHGFDAMRPIMLKSGVEKADEILNKGGSVQDAIAGATTAALWSGFMGSAPMSLEGNLLKRLATGVPVGMAVTELGRNVQNAAMPANMQQPFSLEENLVGGVTGSLMAGAMGHAAQPSAPSRTDLGYRSRMADAVSDTIGQARTIDRAAQQQAMADLGKAKSVDEAVAAAERAVSTPNTDTSISAMMKAIRPLRGEEPAPRMDTAIPGERIEPTFGEQSAPVETPTGLLHDQQEPSHDRNAAADAVPLRDGRAESIEAGAVGMGVAEAGRESAAQPADRGQGDTGKAVSSGAKDIPVADQTADRQPTLDQPKAIIIKDKTPITLTTEKVGDFHIITAYDAAGKEVGNLTYATTEKNGQRINPTVEVDPSMQRKGLATAMYDHAEANGGLIPERDAAGAVRTDDGAAFRDARAGKVAEPEAPKPLSAAEQKRADKIASLSDMKDKELRAMTQNQKTPQYLKLEAANVLNERKSARSEKASAAAKRSAKSMGIDPERETMAVAIAKLGGIDREAAEGRMKLTPEELSIRGHGIKRVFVKGGMSLDEAAEKLSELGYINRDEHGKADLRDFEDKLGEVAGGNEVHTPQGLMRKAAEEHAKAMEEIGAKNESEYAEVEQHVDEAPDKLQSFIDAVFDSPITNRTLSDEELDNIFGPARTSESVSQDRASAPADESHQRDQAPPPAKADAKPEVDTGEDIPVRYFKSVKVDHLVHIEDEGTTETIKVSAKDALASVREDIDSYKQLLDCLKG